MSYRLFRYLGHLEQTFSFQIPLNRLKLYHRLLDVNYRKCMKLMITFVIRSVIVLLMGGIIAKIHLLGTQWGPRTPV